MSKIICDVCGTRYPETAEACPICGCVRAGGGKTVADDILMEEAQPTAAPAAAPVPGVDAVSEGQETSAPAAASAGAYSGYSSGERVRGGRFSKANVRKRNQGKPVYDMPEERPRTRTNADESQDGPYGFNEPVPKRKSNVVLNVLLVIVIVALLCVTGYIFSEYFLPGILLSHQETIAPTEEPTVPTTEPATEAPTEEPTIPCTGLEWVDAQNYVILEEAGQSWLLNIVASPADTTDEITYYSSDESVVTVDSEGCLTAVGEGEAVVVVTCGEAQVQCDVACVFMVETEPPTEEAEPATEAPTEAPTEPLKDVTLEVNYTDITLTGHGQQFTFKLTGLSNEEATWTSDDESVATVENGTVTRVGKGTANITVTYGEQQVVIVVRCRNK